MQAAIPHCADDGLTPLLAWVVEHLDQPHDVAGLARRAHLSRRTFARRFRDAMGTTPHRWLLKQRIAFAQQLLEQTELAVEEVARRPASAPQPPCASTSSASSTPHPSPTGTFREQASA